MTARVKAKEACPSFSDPMLSLQRFYQSMHLSVKSPSKAPLLWVRIGYQMSKMTPSQDYATPTGSSAVTTTMGTTVPAYARSAMTSSDTTCASQMAACPACPVGLGNTAISVSSQAPTRMEGRRFPPKKVLDSCLSFPSEWVYAATQLGLKTTWGCCNLGLRASSPAGISPHGSLLFISSSMVLSHHLVPGSL